MLCAAKVDSMIIMGPFQLGIFYGSIKFRFCEGLKWEGKWEINKYMYRQYDFQNFEKKLGECYIYFTILENHVSMMNLLNNFSSRKQEYNWQF